MSDDADDVLERVLGPIDTERFFETYWERLPLHVSRDDAAHFASLLTLPRIERLLSSTQLSFPDAQLTRYRDPVAPDDYTDEANRIVPLRFARHHAAGATIVISRAQRFVDSLADVCRGVGAGLSMRCQTNVYLSPPASQGFDAHYDAHDVCILQIAGTKTFRFYAGGPDLPLPHHRFDPASTARGETSEEIVLEPGDTLYIPRGVMHDASAHDDASSLHVTLGLFPITVHDVLQEVLRVASERDVGLRRAVAGRPAAGSRRLGTPSLGDLPALLERAFSAEHVGEALSRLRDERAIESVPDCAGLLSRPASGADPTLASHIAVRERASVEVERQLGVVKLRMPGQVLELGGAMGHAVDALVTEGRSRVGDLPGLDDEQRLTLSRRLVEESVVDIVKHVSPS